MKAYLENLLPRLIQFSEGLDRKEIFIDIPWITIDSKQNKFKYIFKRNGELIMSSNGQVKIGSWEYLPSAKSLLIDRIEDKILLNQYFVNGAVMALKLDNTDDSFILANEKIIPNYNVSAYLDKLYYRKNNIETIKLKNNLILEILNFDTLISRNAVTINGESVNDGVFENLNDNLKYEIKDSCISRVLIDIIYTTDKGNLMIIEETNFGYSKGDLAFLNGEIAPDGKYKLGFLKSLYIKNGTLVGRRTFNHS